MASTLKAVRHHHLPTGQHEAALFSGVVLAEPAVIQVTAQVQRDGTHPGAVGFALA